MEHIAHQQWETISGRRYPVSITYQAGQQTLQISGKSIPAQSLVIFESELGRSRCFIRSGNCQTPGELACQQAGELAAEAMRQAAVNGTRVKQHE